MKHAILGIGVALLMVACQMAGYGGPTGVVREGVPGKLDEVRAVASNDAEPLSSGEASGTTGETVGVSGLELPATFRGDLPCADCEGIRYHLDLWPDGVFHLRRAWLGKPGIEDDRGRWRKDPSRPVIILYGGREMPLQFEVRGSRSIRKLDIEGQAIDSDLPYDLTGDGALTPTDLSLGLQGMFTYMADAARFEECLTSRSYPVAMESDYIKLERAYLEADKPEPGVPLMVSFEGDITRKPAMDGDAMIPTVIVRRFIGVWPGQRCRRSTSKAGLSDQ